MIYSVLLSDWIAFFVWKNRTLVIQSSAIGILSGLWFVSIKNNTTVKINFQDTNLACTLLDCT